MNIAIIPARSGSKRIKNKNIKVFNGKPMISWVIEIAKISTLFDKIIVSTDTMEIANIALNAGAEVPFIREKNLADDFTPTVPVIADALIECGKLGLNFQNVCCLYPCSPFTNIKDLKKSYNIFLKKNLDFIYPVTEFRHSIFRCMKRGNDGQMKFLYPEHELTRTQDLEIMYHDAGQFYWGKSDAWLNNKKMHTDGNGYVIPNWRVVDIDTKDDWKRAEFLFQMYKNLNFNN